MPDGKGKRLMRDLETNEVLRRKLDDLNLPDADAEKLVDSWEMLDDVGRNIMKKDPDILRKTSELLNNPKVMNAIGGEEGLKKVFKAYDGPCNTCGNLGRKALKNVDEHLEDIKNFVNKFDGKEGYDEVLAALKVENSPNLQDGLSHMLDKVNKLDPAKVDKFEGKIADALADADNLDKICIKCKFDAKMLDGTLKEFKSYGKKTIEKISGSDAFKKQFKQYLQSVDNMDKLEYVFNKKKLAKLGDEVAQRNFVKEEFRKLLSKNADDLYNSVGASKMNKLFDVDNKLEFKDLVKNGASLDESIYNFIKIK